MTPINCQGRGCGRTEQARYLIEIRLAEDDEHWLSALVCRACTVDVLYLVTDAYAKDRDADACGLEITPLARIADDEIAEYRRRERPIDELLKQLGR